MEGVLGMWGLGGWVENMFVSIPLSPIRRRRCALLFGFSIPVACLALGLLTDYRKHRLKPKIGLPYLLVATIFPAILTFFCLCFVAKIRASTYRTQQYLWLVIFGFVISTGMSLFSSTAGQASGFALIISCLFILWAWIVENAVGVATPLRMTSTCASLAVSYARSILDERKHHIWWLGIVGTGCLFIVLTSFAWRYSEFIFPNENPPPQSKESDLAAAAATHAAVANMALTKAQKAESLVEGHVKEIQEAATKINKSLEEAQAAQVKTRENVEALKVAVQRADEDARVLAEATSYALRARRAVAHDVERGANAQDIPNIRRTRSG